MCERRCKDRGCAVAAICGKDRDCVVAAICESATMQAAQRVRVGIIGGGAAGVIAAKTLREAGHSVVLFEKAAQLGGVWKYEDKIHTDASLYKSLHTNLPTSIMQLDDFHFPSHLSSFVAHTDVLAYIQDYANHFKVPEVARLNSTVVGVSKLPDATWQIDVTSPTDGSFHEVVDKVLICNGHFATPSYATIPGIWYFKGETLHSHDYRTPEPFKNKRVLLLGCGPSGQDISLELAQPGHASQVTVAYREYEPKERSPFDKRLHKPSIDRFLPDGTVVFTDGTTQEAPDVFIYCTGYLYIVKNVAPKGILYPELALPTGELDKDLSDALIEASTSSAAIAPLYKQFFSIEEPDVAFVGLPFSNLPFLCFELQAKWAASVFRGDVSLPSKQQMYTSFFDYVRLLPYEVDKLHKLGERQPQYFEEIGSFSGTKVSRVILDMYSDAAFLRRTYPFHYRLAEYTKEPSANGQWVRRLQLTDPDGRPTEEVVQSFA